MSGRVERVRNILARHDAGAAVLSFLPDIRWACGFTGSNGLLIVRQGEAHFITDGRYTVQAEQEVQGARVHIAGSNLFDYAAEQRLLSSERTVIQSDHLTVSQFDRLRERFPDTEWLPVSDLLVQEVAEKDDEEVERIRQAQSITEAVFDDLLGTIQPGMTEKEIAAEIVHQHLLRGAERMSFDPIVASGPNGALPHARPTDRAIRKGELVVLDFGCFREGYASDMTRTVAVGEPGEEARNAYGIVLQAQQAALACARAGMPANELDGAARHVFTDAGLGAYFTHGLGHGVGLQIHEWPRVSHNVTYPLPHGAVVTIEPGVYLPGRFGIRIEDMVALRRDGCENLTSSPKELIVL